MLRRICSLGLLPGVLFLALPFTAGAQTFDSSMVRGHFAAPEFAPEFHVNARKDESRQEPKVGPRLDTASPNGANASGFAAAHLDLAPLFSESNQDAVGQESDSQAAEADEDREVEGYHWKGLLWQSFAFIGAENAFRLATDHHLRYLISEGPYWHDYVASLKHWDMTRWSDGDDFLVDYIGHPMQGAVSAYLEIQNSPSQRNLRFSNTRDYWNSRFKAFLWATAFSTQQKVGPLGEAAVGSDGGFTYGQHCATEPCRDPNAKYTNDTGWTDFIATPVGGIAWVMGEDLLDRYVSDRVWEAHPGTIFSKILRGTLNPTRTAANALRGKTPWYRDYEHPAEAPRAAGVFVDNEGAVRNLPRYEIFPHFNALSIPVNTANCWFCRKWTQGGGVGFSMRLSRWVDFDSDVDYQPNISPVASNRAGGSLLMGTFGLRTGFATPRYSLKVALRPGFVSYDHAFLTLPTATNPTPAIGRVTHFATALAINGDYVVVRHMALRWEFGNTPVRYLHNLTPPGVGTAPNYNWLSHQQFMTNENWTYQVGPVLRF